MNILLLGETGAGKSTFINGLSTYFTHPTLDEALKIPFVPLIPIKFQVSGSSVEVGVDKNESGEPGKSATQQPRTYVLGWNGITVRLLDTPGIGDTRGVEQDQINFSMILKHIKCYNYIHGICILLKSGQSRITPFFRSCIKQLLAHLHQDAINNIAFVVTHGITTGFDPAVTISSLQGMLAKVLEGVKNEINTSTVYCVDNEAIKYLAQKSANVVFLKESRSKAAAEDAWEESYKAMNKLFFYFSQLVPHDTTKTYSLNQTREICLVLGGPLADSTKKILEAQADIEKQKNEILQSLQEGSSLQSALTTTQKTVRNVTDSKEWLVCDSDKCKRIVYEHGVAIYIPGYCKSHDPNWATSLVPSKIGKVYSVMTLGLGAVVPCGICGCSSWHHRFTFEKVIEEAINTINPQIQKMIEEKKSKADIKNEVLKQSKENIAKLEQEVEFMRKVQITACQFLSTNSIVQSADAYLDRLEQLREEEQQSNPGSGKLAGLEQSIANYAEQKKSLQTIASDTSGEDVSVDNIKSLLAKLYALPNYGKRIKDSVEKKMMASLINVDEVFHAPSLNRYNLPVKK